MQQDLDNEFWLLPVSVIHTVNLPVEFLMHRPM
jgi:hypothetical protein